MKGLGRTLRRIANETAELPGVRLLAEPLYRRRFRQPYRHGNAYCGVYRSYAEARSMAPRSMPTTYDVGEAAALYRTQLEHIRVSDYPLLHWLSRLLAAGQHSIFDLGGHIGVSYYGFRRYLDYPQDMRWTVHDVPTVMAAGRERALQHDPERRLSFADSRDAADGTQLLLSTGALQYLDYSLPEFLQRLERPPPHVLVNLTPMHPSRGYFTLQNLGIAICPYRVMAVPDFLAGMKSLGYGVVDRWESFERELKVPFEPECTIDRYYGFYLRRGAPEMPV